MIDVVDWPEALTIPDEIRDLKTKMLSLLRDEEEIDKEQELEYVVAVSSGKAVTEEIPKQIGRRAGWASQQGANFVEIIIENPAQLIMDQDMLVNLAGRLNLHYNIHSSTNLAYAMSYRQMQGAGYDPAHEYTVKLLKETKRFRRALDEAGLDPAEDGLPRLYSINPHMAVGQIPAEEDRLAQDVSVDPFGHEIRYSDLWENKEARLGVWKYYLWEYQNIKEDVNEFAQILGNIEEVGDAQDYIRENLIELLAAEGYIDNELIDFINTIRREGLEQIGQTLDMRPIQFQDLPDSIEELQNHVNGTNLAQRLATVDPSVAYDRLPTESEVPEDARTMTQERMDEVLADAGLSIPDTRELDLSQDTWRQLNEQAQKAILDEDGKAFQEVVDFLGSSDEEYEEERKPSQVMRNIVGGRRFQDDFNKESTIFRRLIPLWMPFADEEQVQQIWEGITGESFSSHEALIETLYHGPNAWMDSPRKEEDVIAAASGAYVWGHFTQTPPGYEKTLVEYLDEADMFMSFEAHFAGGAENTRIWKPKDMVEVVKAINSTPVETGDGEERTFDRTRVTIDMEHLATQKVDPRWVVDPDEDGRKEGYKGLDEGDGELILMQHVTHPYIGEQQPGHFHGPIKRGDTLVYEYMHMLIEKGMATTDMPSVFMYEMGAEKDETIFMLRLMLRMIEYGIEPEELKDEGNVMEVLNKDQPENLREYLIQKFFGVTDTEVQHEWQEIFEHALDPLDDMLESTEGSHTWLGRAATEGGTRPEDWQKEKYK